MPVYRYQLNLFDAADAAKKVPGSLTAGASAPPIYKDITAPSNSKADLDEYMASKGFAFVSTDPVNTPAQQQASDSNTVHTNVAGELAAITLKATPVSNDILLIEDSAASNAKKRITVGSLPSGGGGAVSSVFTRTGAVVAQSGDYTAAQVTFSPNGNIAATTAQAAIQEVRDESVQDGDSAGGQLGGTYPNPDVRGIRETSGPSNLTIGAIADGQLLRRSGSSLIGVSSTFDIRDVIAWDHFTGSSVSSAQATIGTSGFIYSGTGTGNAIQSVGEAGHPGIIRLTGGSAGTARAGIHLGDTTFRNVLAGGSAPIYFECLVKFRVGVASTNFLRCQMGLGSGWTLSNPNPLTDGIYFRLEPGTSGNLFGVVASSSTRSTVDLGVAAAVNTWYRLGFIYTPGGTPQVQFQLNGSNVGSPVTTNIPSVVLGVGFRADSGGTTSSNLDVDYFTLTQVTNKET